MKVCTSACCNSQMVYEELAESFTINMKLQRADGIAAVGTVFGQLLAAAGQTDEALQVLAASATACDKLGRTEQADHVRRIQKEMYDSRVSDDTGG